MTDKYRIPPEREARLLRAGRSLARREPTYPEFLADLGLTPEDPYIDVQTRSLEAVHRALEDAEGELAHLRAVAAPLGSWMSAALDCPTVCQEYKAAIGPFLDALPPPL